MINKPVRYYAYPSQKEDTKVIEYIESLAKHDSVIINDKTGKYAHPITIKALDGADRFLKANMKNIFSALEGLCPEA